MSERMNPFDLTDDECRRLAAGELIVKTIPPPPGRVVYAVEVSLDGMRVRYEAPTLEEAVEMYRRGGGDAPAFDTPHEVKT